MTANESARITNCEVTNKIIEFSLFKQQQQQQKPTEPTDQKQKSGETDFVQLADTAGQLSR